MAHHVMRHLAVLVASFAALAGATASCGGPASTCRAGGGPETTQGQALLQQRSRVQSVSLQMEEAEAAPLPLTVLCWNVLYKNFGGGGAAKRAQLADVVARADVAGLQECMSEDEMQAALGSRMSKAPNTDRFNCIFYKPGAVGFGGISGRQYLGDDARDNYSRRYFSWAKLSHEGRTFWLFSTHWCLDGPCAGSAGGRRHKLSAQRILQKRRELGAEGEPTIITADANSHMDGYDNDDGVRWLLANGFEIAGKGPMAGGIDYTFVSRGHWDIGRHRVGPTRPSDHPSFTVQLTLRGSPGHGAPPSPQPVPAQPVPPLPHQCSPFSNWPDVDRGVTCGSCMALVLTAPYGGRCDKYCGSFGHVCLAAAEERDETCDVLSEHRCDEEIRGTSDMLCTCGLPDAPKKSPPPAEAVTCRAMDQWPDVDRGVTCSGCTALVLTAPHGGRCDKYCESFDHVCLAAAEERDETCDVLSKHRCDEEIRGTSDMLCTCGLPEAPMKAL